MFTPKPVHSQEVQSAQMQVNESIMHNKQATARESSSSQDIHSAVSPDSLERAHESASEAGAKSSDKHSGIKTPESPLKQ